MVPDHDGVVDRTLAEAFAAAGADVAELPGPLVPDFEGAVDRLGELVDGYGGPVVLAGHAVGGMIVVRYAQRCPTAAGLVLTAPVLGPWPMLDLLSGDEDVPGIGRTALAAIEECLTTIDFDHPLGDELPALWVHGTDDTRVPMADTRAGLDRVRGLGFEELIIPGAGHAVLDTPGVRSAIVAFTARVVGQDSA